MTHSNATLLAIVQGMVDRSTSPEAKNFDCSAWLAQWLEHPQHALGGCKPVEMMNTPEGIEAVRRLLGAMESGSYQ